MSRFTRSIPLAAAAVLLVGCAQTSPADLAAAGPNTPGWTGRTIVAGTSSTVAGDAAATEMAQKWGIGRRN